MSDLRESVIHVLESWLGNEYDDIPVPQFLSPVGSESAEFNEGKLIGYTATLIADRILALFAEERRGKHDCDRWAEEGMGCAICNPTARYMRETWDDPIRKRCEKAEARVKELREALARYGEHSDTCMRRQIGTASGDPDCTCGLDTILDRED